MKRLKEFIKELFSANTKSTSYLKIIINFLIGIIFPILLLLVFNFIPVHSPFRFLMIIPLAMVLYMIGLLSLRLFGVSDNKEAKNVKRKGYKFKYKPITLSLDDFVFWVNNSEVPETIYLKSILGINYIFEVSFDVDWKNGKFYNKRLYLDEKLLNSCDDCVALFNELEIINNDYIKVYETFDHNKPEVLLEIIRNLKNR